MYADVIKSNHFTQKVIPIIDKAQKSIDIVVFDWRWYSDNLGSNIQLFNQSIIRAVRRGVRVQVISNSNDIIKTLSKNGVKAKKFISKKLLHTKLMIIDEKIVITGSHNYTMSAFNSNFELSVILYKLDNISEFSNYFLNLWQK